jgi:hypothetical protein
LAKAGYAVEQLPESKVQGEKNPDFRIEGQIFDNYAPSGGRTRNFADRIQDKVDDNQTERVVLNLTDSTVDAEQVREQLHTWPIPGLREVIVIDRHGGISHLYP